MSRRPGAGVVDRHALLSTSAFPSSSRSSPGPNRNASPFEQPYLENTSDPYSEYNVGAPKKEAPLYGGAGLPITNGNGMNGRPMNGSIWGARSAEQLEEQNDDKLEGLSAKVRILKDITVGIGNEVRDSTKDLDSLGEAFSNTSAFLGNTFNRMNRMARRQGSWFCNMMIFIVFIIWIFIFLWWWRR